MNLVKDEVQRLCSRLEVEYEDVISNCRRHDLVMARVIIAEYLQRELSLGPAWVGKVLGRDRSTIVYYGKVYENDYKYSPLFRRMADLIMKKV